MLTAAMKIKTLAPWEKSNDKPRQHMKKQRHSFSKAKIMVSGPLTSWQIDGETIETVTDFIFLGSKITADVYCSLEIKRCLLLERKAMTNLVK